MQVETMSYDQLLEAWREANAVAKAAAENEMTLRRALVDLAFKPSLTEEGTKRRPASETEDLVCLFKQNYRLANKDDVDEALNKLENLGNEGVFIAERIVKWKPELSLSEYRDLAPQYKTIIDEVLTITPATPSVKIETRKKGR